MVKHELTYSSWRHMKDRCDNPNHVEYHRYGGRGISYTTIWSSYAAFVGDMGERPTGLMLERIDNERGYYKENCRWATKAEQLLNKGIYENNASGFSGVHFCLAQKVWVARASKGRKRWQLYKGYSLGEAIAARKTWEVKGKPLPSKLDNEPQLV